MMPNGPGACLTDSGLASRAVGAPWSPPLQPLSQTVIVTMRLWQRWSPARIDPQRKNRHISCCFRAHGATDASVTAGETWGHHDGTDTGTRHHTTARTARRADAGTVRLSQRDIDGLMLRGEHYGAPVRPARHGAAGPPGPAARDHGAVAPRRVRRHRAARPGAGVVLADPGRDDRDRARVPRHPPRAGPPGARPRGARGPAVAGRPVPPGSRGSPGGIPSGGCAPTAPPPAARARRRRGDPLAQHRGQPVRRAGVGGRGGADPQADRPDHADHDRAAVADAVRAGGLPDRPGRPAGGHPRGPSLPAGEQPRVVVRELPAAAFAPEPSP